MFTRIIIFYNNEKKCVIVIKCKEVIFTWTGESLMMLSDMAYK